MHPRFTIGLGLFVTLLMMPALVATSGTAAPRDDAGSQTCLAEAALAPTTIDVPVNGTVTFDVGDLLGASTSTTMVCPDMAAIDAASFVAHAGEGGVTIIPGSQNEITGWSATRDSDLTQRFVFTPKPDFSGVSQGWEFVIYGRDASGEVIRIGVVKTTFRVRNSIPIARDDAVTVAPRAGGICVSAESGLLANDRDANGDPVIVYSDGVTSYPWGAVEIRNDGSYRVTVTDPQVSGTAQVRYVVWDQTGSTASSDVGILTLTFDDGALRPAFTGHHRFLMLSDAGTGGCGRV